MLKDERLRITINGHAVAEVDATASNLSIFLAVAGVPCEGDPYNIPGVPREAVKAWVTCTLGNGKPIAKWPDKTCKGIRAAMPLRDVRSAILRRHPSLEKPGQVVAQQAAELGIDPRRMLTHYLMGLEAAALTAAMECIWRDTGIVPLPMHDGLIVPKELASTAKDAIRAAYRTFAGVAYIGVKIATAP